MPKTRCTKKRGGRRTHRKRGGSNGYAPLADSNNNKPGFLSSLTSYFSPKKDTMRQSPSGFADYSSNPMQGPATSDMPVSPYTPRPAPYSDNFSTQPFRPTTASSMGSMGSMGGRRRRRKGRKQTKRR
jgi:hypothetical protein